MLRHKIISILTVVSLLAGCEVYAFDIVYPKKTSVTINANSTFFIGSSKTPLTINGQGVLLHQSGGFAHVVKLKDGENTFVIKSENERKIFVITKPVIKGTFKPQEFKKYDCIKSAYVINTNVPLRSTPVDFGINRITHLQRNILLNIDGEKNGFYRVILAPNKYGWISKGDVKLCENYKNTLATLKGYDFTETENYYEFIFHFDKTVPFEITEDNPLTLKFYGVQNDTDNNHQKLEITDNIYTKKFPFDQKIIGYSGQYTGNDFVWKIRKIPKINLKKPLKNINIVIDAGHGGYENGAIGCLGDKEKDVNLNIARYLEEYLKKQGANVVMTRNDDSYLGLQERVNITKYTDALIFLSIHGNALPDGADPNKRSGTSVYYYYNQSKDLANTILTTMTENLELNNDGLHQASFAVVRNTSALSILIETAYLINPDDNSKLVTQEFQKNCAKAIVDGLEEYIEDNFIY